MDWKKYWEKIAINNPHNKINQVQRKDEESTYLTVNHITRILDITRVDKVLDVCCGNGIITCEIAKKCDSIVGIDQSENLLETAKKDFSDVNVDYVHGSAFELNEFLGGQKFDKIYLQFSFQYFDKRRYGNKVISEMLKCLKPKGKIFIGDIPEHNKISDYYNSTTKKARLLKDKLLKKNEMGKFWKVSELDAICVKNDVKGTYLKQPKELPYSHYRFDYLIEN